MKGKSVRLCGTWIGTMISIFDIIAYILICLVVVIGAHIRASLDAYFTEKARNWATKQDIDEITTRTEIVQTKFHEIEKRFDADLAFKYQFYEKQYKELYSELYQKVCKSETLRYILNNLAGQHMFFSDFPVADLDREMDGISNQTTVKAIVKEIVDLVNQKHIYASSELMKVVCMLENMERCEDCLNQKERTERTRILFKMKLMNIIVEDYNWLRRELHFSGVNNETGNLENGKFIEDL